jgi:hypothetical protein
VPVARLDLPVLRAKLESPDTHGGVHLLEQELDQGVRLQRQRFGERLLGLQICTVL